MYVVVNGYFTESRFQRQKNKEKVKMSVFYFIIIKSTKNLVRVCAECCFIQKWKYLVILLIKITKKDPSNKATLDKRQYIKKGCHIKFTKVTI